MKNCINFTRRREICRLQEFSSSHYPSQSLRAFLVAKRQLQKLLFAAVRRIVANLRFHGSREI